MAIHNLNGSITHTRVPVTGAEWDSSNDMAWSPDGNSLAYEYSSDPRVAGSEHIWVMNTHRPYEPRQVSTNGGMEPSWSPDSSEILYGGFEADLWTVNADGTNDADLTNTPDIAESRPDWSPDGNSIAYLASSEQQRGLFVATASGADAHLVTPGASTCCGAPDWSPDGKQIAFIGDPGVNIVNSDGSDLRVITAAGYDAQPDWQASAAQ